MDIKAELEALRDHYERKSDAYANAKCYVTASEIEDVAFVLQGIIARLPTDAVVVPREPSAAMSLSALSATYDANNRTVEAVWRAMLQAAEENRDEVSNL